MAGSLPFRKSLLVRLVAGAVLVAAVAIAATAFLAATATSRQIRQEQGQTAAADAEIYDALLGYAATHASWADVGPVADAVARRTGRRVALSTVDGLVSYESSPGSTLSRPELIDPLNATTEGARDGIDPRASGPFTLPPDERTRLRRIADEQVACLAGYNTSAHIQVSPTGRPNVIVDGVPGTVRCPRADLTTPTATERRALGELTALVNACLARQRIAPVQVTLDYSWTSDSPVVVSGMQEQFDTCIGSARKEQLRRYTAPPALLTLGQPAGTEPSTAFEFSLGRTTGIAALVLAFTVGVSILGATRLVRPLHALTGAAQRMRDGDLSARAEVRPGGELGQLTDAFNEMASQRAWLERQRGELVSDVAHELRNPLANIRNLLEAAQDGVVELDPDLVSSLLEEALLLQHVIDDLRDLSAAEAGELRLHPEPVDLRDSLGQVVAMHQTSAERAGIGIESHVDGDLVLTADPVRLRQVLANLVSNAVRHTTAGGTVTIRASQHGDVITIAVSDTGPGIAAEDLPHVFERFWRAEKSRSRQTGGSGLGLAIVRDLVAAHHGTVTVTSPSGEGATFTIRLPVMMS